MSHYYGDIVRRLFIGAAFIMTATLPFFSPLIGEPLLLSVIGILVLSVAAGLASPVSPASALLNVLIALGGLVVFESYAATRFPEYGTDFFFWANQALALIFLFALYFSMKTLRNMPNVRRAADK